MGIRESLLKQRNALKEKDKELTEKINRAKSKEELEALRPELEDYSRRMDIINEALINAGAVSYTHLDVYKRQLLDSKSTA